MIQCLYHFEKPCTNDFVSHNWFISHPRFAYSVCLIIDFGIHFFLCLLTVPSLVLQEGLTVVENRTADIIQETRKLQIRKKGSGSAPKNQTSNTGNSRQQPMTQNHLQHKTHADLEIQLKASRDVRCQLCNAGYITKVIQHRCVPFVLYLFMC